MSKLSESLLNQGLIGNDEAAIANSESYDDGMGGTFVDADTIDRDGQRYRLTGFDAREIDKNYKGTFKDGQIGGKEQQIAAAKLAREHGFVNLVETGETDPFGRKLADLQDVHGNSFSQRLLSTGVVNPDQYTTQEAQAASSFGLLARKARESTGMQSDWDVAANWVDEAIAEQTKFDPEFRKRAGTERELAEIQAYDEEHGTNYLAGYSKATTQIRSKDRDILNRAKNPLSTSWEIGVQSASDGLTGTLELVGHETGWEGLENWAEGQLESQRLELQDMPKVLTDFKEVEGIGDALQYIGNMAAISLPYMVTTIGAVAAAPATGGLSLTAPAGIYAGQVWNEMGDTDEAEKNAALAIGAGISMAALDRLGIAGLGNASLLNDAGRKAVIKELVDTRGMTEEAAKQALVGATRREAADFSGNALQFSKDLLDKQNVLRATLGNALQNATTEGITEISQETVGYLAAVAGSDSLDYNPNELLERIQHAAVGGAALGGAFSIPATGYDVAAWNDIRGRTAPADLRRQSRQSRWREKEIAENGRVRSITELQEEAQKNANERGFSTDITERATRSTKAKRDRTISERFTDGLEAVPGLWRGITRHIFDDDIQDRSTAARALADMFGGNLEQTHSGATYETSKHLLTAKYRNIVGTPRQILTNFGYAGRNLKKAERDFSNKAYAAYDAALDENGDLDWNRLEGTKFEADIPQLKQLNRKIQAMTDKLWLDQSAHNPELKKLKNYGWRVRSVDKVRVESDPQGFKNDLITLFNLDDASAQKLTDTMVDSNDITDISDAFSLLEEGGFKPSAHKGRTLNMSDNHQFASKWLSNNLFYNLGNSAKSAARYTSYQQFIGDNNSKVNELFQKMEDELIAAGTDRDEAAALVDQKARMFRDYLDAESGNYKRPKTQLGKNLQRFQKHIMFYTTVAGLPLATLSSFVEKALVYKSLEPKHVAEISRNAKEFAEAFVKDTNRVADATPARQALRDTGFFDWEVGAATITGATEQTNKGAERLEVFFKAIQLTQWTDYTRALRASFAMDYINDKLELVYASQDADVQTNEMLEAREALANIGLNVTDYADLMQKKNDGTITSDEEAQLVEDTRVATFNWVNDAIVLPQSAIRPLFYQNPQLALFTQFHGFISTFTANQLPKLYKSAFKGKVPSIKYNAFAIIATMIMLGFLSQYLKDLLKYNKATPYLDTAEKVQRGIGATGLLGTGERVLNLFNPIYEKQYDTTLGKLFGELSGESAAITNTLRGGEAALELAGGDVEQAARKGGKLLPLIGPFSAVQDRAREEIF